MTHHYKDYLEMWESMRRAQENKGGFTVTVRELMGIFKVDSTNTVYQRLRSMVNLGFVKEHQEGKKTFYRALSEEEMKSKQEAQND